MINVFIIGCCQSGSVGWGGQLVRFVRLFQWSRGSGWPGGLSCQGGPNGQGCQGGPGGPGGKGGKGGSFIKYLV